ncbi:MAG TPA: hypothetical protein VMF90_02445 [Rhizobiaceae bacterium]|nr:hypothetical protein [Rhizobiaceae bacterium]
MTSTAIFAALAMPATAQSRHDPKLEQAAAAIVAAKMGELRGGFAYDVELARVMLPDFGPTGSISPAPAYNALPVKEGAGLVPALERRSVRIVL